MKKLNKREIVILCVTLGLALFFVLFQWVIKPMQEGSLDIDDRLRVVEDRLLKARQMASQKESVEAMRAHLLNTIGGSDAEETQIPAIIPRIETAARESNIHIANIQPKKSTLEKEILLRAVELEIDGQWLDIVHFFSLLQQEPNFYFINELNLEKYSDTTNSLRGRIVVARMSVNT